MSFLDNLENNLKSLESRDETTSRSRRNRAGRESERARALAAAPYAEKLKKGAFTNRLLSQATRLGFAQRSKVYIAWLGNVLRLEARDKRLELRPGANGVTAHFIENGDEVRSIPVDLEGDPEALAREWLG